MMMAWGLVFIHMVLHISGRADQVLERVARPPAAVRRGTLELLRLSVRRSDSGRLVRRFLDGGLFRSHAIPSASVMTRPASGFQGTVCLPSSRCDSSI